EVDEREDGEETEAVTRASWRKGRLALRDDRGGPGWSWWINRGSQQASLYRHSRVHALVKLSLVKRVRLLEVLVLNKAFVPVWSKGRLFHKLLPTGKEVTGLLQGNRRVRSPCLAGVRG